MRQTKCLPKTSVPAASTGKRNATSFSHHAHHVSSKYYSPMTTSLPALGLEGTALQRRMCRVENVVISPDVSGDFRSNVSDKATAADMSNPVYVAFSQCLGNTHSLQALEQTVSEHVYWTIQSDWRSSNEIYESYFANIHKWLPILSRKHLYHRHTESCAMPTASSSLLLLCIHLLIKIPDQYSVRTEQQTSHKIARCLYFFLQSSSPVSIELVQSGLLLSTYEHTSGLLEEAFSSIGTCARMAYSLGLRAQAQTQTRSREEGDKMFRLTEMNNLWWGIIIRDRWGHS
jgi:hypothetical protein